MRIGWPSRGMICPAFGPSVTVRVRGVPRGCFFGLGCLASFGCFTGRGVSTRVPKMSDRITDTADRTKSHRTAKNPSLISVSVSSDTRSPRSLVQCAGVSDNHGCVPDDDRRAIVEQRLLDSAAVHAGAVGRTKVDGAHRNLATAHVNPDLNMSAGYARIVDPKIGLGPSSDDDTGRLQRMLLPVDLEDDRRRSRGRALTCDGRDLGVGATAYPEASGRQALGTSEGDVQGTRECVTLLRHMLADQSGELGGQRVAVRSQPIEVGLRQLDVETVRSEESISGQNLYGIVDLTLQGGCDLYWLHGTTEGTGERPGDYVLEPLLEAVEYAHD